MHLHYWHSKSDFKVYLLYHMKKYVCQTNSNSSYIFPRPRETPVEVTSNAENYKMKEKAELEHHWEQQWKEISQISSFRLWSLYEKNQCSKFRNHFHCDITSISW